MPQDTPSRKLDQYIVRFPDGMRDQLKAAAERNNRSLNAEIVSRLGRTLDEERVTADSARRRLAIAELADRIRETDETGSSTPREPGAALKYPAHADAGDLVRNIVTVLDQLNTAVGALASTVKPSSVSDIDKVAAEVSEMADAIKRERPASKRRAARAEQQ